MEPAILFEDDDVAVINKPAGLVVHADGKTEEPTLVDWLLLRYPSMKGVGEPFDTKKELRIINKGGNGQLAPATDSSSVIHHSIPRPGIVHRLDRETSGAMVVAKTQDAYLYLKRQFGDRKVQKRYHLFVWGEMKAERGTIDRPIGKSPTDFRRWSAQRGAKGAIRNAITWYRVLARKNGLSFVEAQPRTGRTHQIRVHFKAIGYPVICDTLYGSKHQCALGFSRTALHARAIKFLERGGKEISVKAPFPTDFLSAFKELDISPDLAF